MAAAGFFYTGKDDIVRCFECNIEISKWMQGDNPMGDHQRWRGSCKFIRRIHCGNVPIDVGDSSVVSSLPVGTDECGLYEVQYRPGSAPDDDKPRAGTQLTPKINSLSKNKVEGNAELENSNSELPESVKPRNIEDARLCKICYCAEMGCVLTPCGHVVACIECALKIDHCVLCEKNIEWIMRVYLA